MGRKPADLWRYADRMDKKFKCKFCKCTFPGGVVRLRAHLSGTKGQGIQVCSKVLKDVRDDALSASNVPNKKSKTDTSSSNSDGSSSLISDTSCSNEVDTSLAKFFEMNDLPCCIVESPSFINLVNVLIKSGSGYVLPSCSTLENQLIPSLRQEVEQYVSSTRQSWEEIGCTLASDIWLNEEENTSFVSIMACSGKRSVLLNTFDIPDNNLSAGFLEGIVHRVVQDVGVGNIVQYIGDDSPYTKLFSELLGSQCPLVFVTRCVVRELKSFFEEVIQKVEWVGSTFEVAKHLADCLCKDDDLSTLMSKYTGGKELEHSSRYDMLESIFEVKEELVKLVQSAEWLAFGYEQRENGRKATEIIASEEFWKQGGEVQMVLKPLFKILQLDDTADSGFGYLYGLMKMVEEAIVSLHNNNRVKFQKLWEIFLSRKGQIINETHKAAAYLNPSYMCNVTVQESREMEKGINYILQKFVSDADEVAFVEQAMHYRQTFSNPSERFKIVAAKTSSPGQWWNAFGDEFPILRKYAVRILNQPCGRSSFNINLSAFGANLVKQRGLVPDLKDLNVRINLVLMETSCADGSKSKRINFEEFDRHKSTNESFDAVLVEAPTHADAETRPLIITSEELPRPKHLKLYFMTVIASPILTGQKVEGYQGSPIHVYLADSATDCVVQDGAPSTLTLTISVLDGDFTNEAPTDECRTREYFDSNDLSSDMRPLVTGDLQLTLVQGVGMLGEFSFNYSSSGTRSGKFRLAVKTYTGDCEGIRILEGISNAFVVEDRGVTRTQHPAACEMHLPKDSTFLGIIAPMEGWWGPLEQMLGESSGSPGDWNGLIWNYNQLQRSCRSLTQTGARRVKKKALLGRSRSCNLRIKMKRRSPVPLDKEKIGNEVFKAAGVQLTIRNNVNQQEDGGEEGEPKAVIDSLMTNSIESPAVTPFGVGVSTSGTEPRPRGETSDVQSPKHLSTAWPLSLTGDEVPEPIEGVHSIPEGGKAEETSTQYTVAHVDLQNGSFSSNPGQKRVSNLNPSKESNKEISNDTPNYSHRGICQSLARIAARRVNKKELMWKLRSRGRQVTLRRGSQALERKRTGTPYFGFKSSESSAFQLVPNGNQKASSKEIEPPSKASNQNVQLQHHHHHHYHRHHQTPELNENISAPTAAAPPCRSLKLANGMEENGGNVSGGGSTNGSDGNNNGSNNTPSGGDDTENGTAKTSGSGGFSGNTNSSAMEDVREALREAALTKFRQKRKERCFIEKVRYQSRKKLAEQRPQIKGQLVKQIKLEGKSGEEM